MDATSDKPETINGRQRADRATSGRVDDPVRLTVLLEATAPPAGSLRREGEAGDVAFAGWLSLMSAIKTVTADPPAGPR